MEAVQSILAEPALLQVMSALNLKRVLPFPADTESVTEPGVTSTSIGPDTVTLLDTTLLVLVFTDFGTSAWPRRHRLPD